MGLADFENHQEVCSRLLESGKSVAGVQLLARAGFRRPGRGPFCAVGPLRSAAPLLAAATGRAVEEKENPSETLSIGASALVAYVSDDGVRNQIGQILVTQTIKHRRRICRKPSVISTSSLGQTFQSEVKKSLPWGCL